MSESEERVETALRDVFSGEQPSAEVGEACASGRTGKTCPFCGSRAALLTLSFDKRGLIDAEWECLSCDESGSVLDGFVLHWEPESTPPQEQGK
jgi:hypothetical protein